MVFIAPSLLAADFTRLGEEIESIEKAGADWIHLDVMDGHMVDNITFGPDIVESIREVTDLVLDVHLMIEHPIKFARRFIEAGADIVTFHVESEDPIQGTIDVIRDAGAEVGLSLRPGTSADALIPFADEIDLALVMTVEPGFGGQGFMSDMVPKISEIYEALGPAKYVSVDGGIGPSNVHLVAGAGANVLVAGTSVFGAEDRTEIIKYLRAKAVKAHTEEPEEETEDEEADEQAETPAEN